MGNLPKRYSDKNYIASVSHKEDGVKYSIGIEYANGANFVLQYLRPSDEDRERIMQLREWQHKNFIEEISDKDFHKLLVTFFSREGMAENTKLLQGLKGYKEFLEIDPYHMLGVSLFKYMEIEKSKIPPRPNASIRLLKKWFLEYEEKWLELVRNPWEGEQHWRDVERYVSMESYAGYHIKATVEVIELSNKRGYGFNSPLHSEEELQVNLKFLKWLEKRVRDIKASRRAKIRTIPR